MEAVEVEGCTAQSSPESGEGTCSSCVSYVRGAEDTWYGGSIELERGMSLEGEVVLALEV